MPAFRNASFEDWPHIAALLRSNGLPLDGARDHLEGFIVAIEGERMIGSAGYEAYGDIGLLRSVAVQQDCQGQGLGRALLEHTVEAARRQGITRLFLLTTTATSYFARSGFAQVPRELVPRSLLSSEEFRGACPASAVLMTRSLTRTE